MTTEDKELIRLAARAFFGTEDEATHAIVSLGWNPLANNEDAFMVMAWLAINFDVVERGNPEESTHSFCAGLEHMEFVSVHPDIYTAARRSITRAAATKGIEVEDTIKRIEDSKTPMAQDDPRRKCHVKDCWACNGTGWFNALGQVCTENDNIPF